MSLKRLLTVLLFAFLTSAAWAQVPRSRHVVVVTLENHSYEQVIGNSSMPYFNSLAQKYGIADQYYATMHNSISALMWLTAGETVTTNDNTLSFFNVDNIVRHMQSNGRSWKVYASALPYVGYLGFNVNEYVKRHNPLAYFTDVESSLKYNILPLSPYFQNDIKNGTLPEYSYVTPDLIEDAHNGTLADADSWLSKNIPQLLASPQFQKDGILFLVWDEGDVQPIDPRGGGGRVATLVIGPGVKRGFHSHVQYNHQSLLRSTCLALAMKGCPGGGQTGVPMVDFFTANNAPLPQVNLMSPALNAVNGTVHISAAGLPGSYPVTSMAAYVGGSLVARSSSASLASDLKLAAGTYTLSVCAWDSSGAMAEVKRTLNVTTPTLAVSMIFPTTTVVSSPLHIEATGISGEYPATGMAAYVGGKLVAKTSVPSLTTDVSMPSGTYTVTVRVWDTAGNTASTNYTVTLK